MPKSSPKKKSFRFVLVAHFGSAYALIKDGRRDYFPKQVNMKRSDRRRWWKSTVEAAPSRNGRRRALFVIGVVGRILIRNCDCSVLRFLRSRERRSFFSVAPDEEDGLNKRARTRLVSRSIFLRLARAFFEESRNSLSAFLIYGDRF